MGIKTSYSQNNTYIACPKHWHLLYKEGLEGTTEGASTYFGSAIDAGVSAMLEGNPDWLKVFYDRWNKSWNFGKSTVIFDNPEIIYGYKDFDGDILEDKDFNDILAWAIQLNIGGKAVLFGNTNTVPKQELIELYKGIADKKKNPYKSPTPDELTFFNRCSWLSMKRKGKLLLNAFHTQFFPKIKRVIATQQKAQIQDPSTGDTITGFIDMVLEIDGYDKPIIFDLKTAAWPYKQEDIDLTQQLTLYSAMKSGEYNTDLVGYVVLCKNIPKTTTSTCKVCGNVKTGRHATCEAINAQGARCNGEWDTKMVPKPEVQVLVEKKEIPQIEDLLIDYGNIILAMKQEIVYKNTSKCTNWYGGICPYYNLCHKGDRTGLVSKKQKYNGGNSNGGQSGQTV